MKLRHVFTVNAVICVLYGTPFAVAPALLLSLYGAPPNGLGHRRELTKVPFARGPGDDAPVAAIPERASAPGRRSPP